MLSYPKVAHMVWYGLYANCEPFVELPASLAVVGPCEGSEGPHRRPEVQKISVMWCFELWNGLPYGVRGETAAQFEGYGQLL